MIGIDEAGYGPILGPLVVGAAAFEVPDTMSDRSLWDVLESSVSREAADRKSRIPVLDSKKLYKRKEGLGRLERSVLSFLTAWRGGPASLRQLLGLVCPGVLDQLPDYDWYRDADPSLPRAADAGGIRIAANLLKQDLAANSIRLAGCLAEVLPEGHYNRLVGMTHNKAVVLSGLVLRLIQRLADAYPGHELLIFVDKQGARSHYGSLLMKGFDRRRLKIIEETDDSSAYELVDDATRWRVRFSQSGESRDLPVALASMIAKYLRELFMECFNDYWLRLAPSVKPTAGYYQDGLRFLRDIEPHLGRLGVERDRLVRQR